MAMNPSSTPDAASDFPAGNAGRHDRSMPPRSDARPEPGGTDATDSPVASPIPQAPAQSRQVRRWKQPKYPGAIEALALLTSRPIFYTPVPRHHVEPRAADGTVIVHDRATDEHLLIYSPRFTNQLRAGHHGGLWYVRHAADVGDSPRSVGYRTAQAAIDALRGGEWKPLQEKGSAQSPRAGCRVSWS